MNYTSKNINAPKLRLPAIGLPVRNIFISIITLSLSLILRLLHTWVKPCAIFFLFIFLSLASGAQNTYTATITPATACSGVCQIYTLTITSTGGSLRSVIVTLPLVGGSPIVVSGVSSFAPLSTPQWMDNSTGTQLKFRATNGDAMDELKKNQSLVITFTSCITVATTAALTFSTQAFGDKNYVPPTFTIQGSQPGITVNALPTAPTGIGAARCGTGTVTISATPGAGETIDWYAASSGGAALSSGSTSYTTPSISATTIYYAQSRNTTTGCVSATRTAVTATVNTVPAAPTGTGASRCGTGTVIISATPGAGETIDWYAGASGGATLLSSNTSYTTPSISATTIYYAESRNTTTGCISASRTSVTATINPIPAAPSTTDFYTCQGVITLDASVATGCSGGTLKWYNAASGGNLLFTGAPFAPTVIVTTTFYVSCTVNGCEGPRAPIIVTIGNVNSGTISADQIICSGAVPAPFTGTAGSGPGNSYKNPTYQWQSGPLSTGPWTDIAGATGQNYTSGTALFATTYFQRQITAVHNGNNGVSCIGYTPPIVVTITAPPTITTQPLTQTVCIGASVTLSVVASSNAPLTYQWKKGAAILVNGGNISGATTASLTINPFAASDAASYTVVVTNGCASTTSNAAVLSAPAALVAGSFNTTPVTACVNYNPGALTVTGTSGGISAYTYQWQMSFNGGAFVNVGNTNPYNPSNLTSAGTYIFRAIVADACNTTATTTTKTITIVPDPSVTIAASGSVCINGNVTLASTVTGGVTNTYEWQSSPDGVSSWAAISGATSPTYPVITSTAGTFYYRLRIPNAASCNQAISNVVTIVVNPLPNVSVTNNSPICTGSNAIFTLTGTSGAVVTYNINGTLNQTATLTGGSATVPVSGATVNQTLNLVSINNSSTVCSQTLSGSSTISVNPKPSPIITHN